MANSIKRFLISFFGLHFVCATFTKGVHECLLNTNIFHENYFTLWLVRSRGVGILLNILQPSVQPYLISMRVIDNWIKYIFWVLLIHRHFSEPVFYKWAQQMINKKPHKWKKMLSIYKYLDKRFSYSFTSIRSYSHQHKISYATSAAHLFRIKWIISVSLLLSLFYNNIVNFIEIINLIEAIQITWSAFAFIIQLLYVISFKYTFNFDSQLLGTMFLLMFTSMQDYECRLKAINRQLATVVMTSKYDFKAKRHDSSNPNSVLKLFNPIKSHQTHFKVIKLKNFCSQLNRLADEKAFACQLTSLLVSNFYITMVVCSIGYFFLFYYGENLLIRREFFIMAIIFLFVPTMFVGCWLGQLLINEVSPRLISFNCYNKLIANKILYFLMIMLKSKTIQTNVYSLTSSNFVSNVVIRKFLLNLELMGHQNDLFSFHLFYFADYSMHTFLQVRN